jgi:hypothetical protein
MIPITTFFYAVFFCWKNLLHRNAGLSFTVNIILNGYDKKNLAKIGQYENEAHDIHNGKKLPILNEILEDSEV